MKTHRNIIRRKEDSEPVFADHQRKPISFELDFSETMGAGFRCLDVLRVAGGNLATVAKNYCVTKKLVTYDKDGNPIWKSICRIEEESKSFSAKSSSKKDAKKSAAFKMLQYVLRD